tara:strand:+ start:37 stop:342 length:306 start_codon:yes stop_codon:yes gene_type:complete
MSAMEYHVSTVSRNGSTTKAVYNLYMSAITTEDELVPDDTHLLGGEIRPVTRRRKTANLTKLERLVLEKDGTLSDEELYSFLDIELATRAAAAGLDPLERG